MAEARVTTMMLKRLGGLDRAAAPAKSGTPYPDSLVPILTLNACPRPTPRSTPLGPYHCTKAGKHWRFLVFDPYHYLYQTVPNPYQTSRQRLRGPGRAHEQNTTASTALEIVVPNCFIIAVTTD